jgi:hypothetical protein
MEGIPATISRKRKARPPAEPQPRVGILLRGDALRKEFEDRGITSYHGMAKALGYSSTGMLHTAFRGGLVSSALIYAIRRYLPDVPYERLFSEGAEVLRDAPPARLAA